MLTGIFLRRISYDKAVAIKEQLTLEMPLTKKIAGRLIDFVNVTGHIQDTLAPRICQRCGSCCYEFKFYTADAIIFHLNKRNPTLLQQLNLPPAPVCQFLSPVGCVLPREKRPIICSTFLCVRFRIEAGQELSNLCLLARKLSFTLERVFERESGKHKVEERAFRLLEEFEHKLLMYGERHD